MNTKSLWFAALVVIGAACGDDTTADAESPGRADASGGQVGAGGGGQIGNGGGGQVGAGGASGGSAAGGGDAGGAGGASGGAPTGGAGGQSTGGTGGSGGAGGAGGAPGIEAFFCQEVCQADDDCSADFHCFEQRCFHRQVRLECDADVQCVPQASGWYTACDDDTACPGQACIEVEGSGRCAVVPSEFLSCEQIGMQVTERPRRGAPGMVGVCTQTRSSCQDGRCTVLCQVDAHCGGEYPHCDLPSGRCQCTPTSCQTNASVCQDGLCRCTSDADCDQGAADTCYGGFCGCSGTAICPEQTSQPGTVWSCEPYSL
jgi:hypothetical protein